MRAVLSEQAVARMGRVGWGVLSQVREFDGGCRVARGLIEGMIEMRCVEEGRRWSRYDKERAGRFVREEVVEAVVKAVWKAAQCCDSWARAGFEIFEVMSEEVG